MKMKMQLSNNLKMFVGILFGAIGFRGLRYVIMCLTLISSVFLKKKIKIICTRRNNKITEIIFRVINM